MELVTTYICKKFDIGVNDNMFGGRLMSLVDDSAASYASQICDTPHVITIKFDEFIFKKPVRVGDIIKIYGRVITFGTSSLQLYMEVRKHNVHNGEQETVTSTHVKFVKIDAEGKAMPIGEKVKLRYAERIKKYGKGLLSAEENSNS